ncbi:MAG: hypothetical protein JXR94_03590 [Candidatus Hydrogenedentes bacterium]|nr:hypothetical protein [Candidatus Hydrogenedentota bacterium]
MAKYLVWALVIVVGSGVAIGASLRVPFFSDEAGTTWTGGAPDGPGGADFIGVLNTTGSALSCAITYREAGGVDRTPSPNTFTIPAYTSLSFRPGRDDPVQENTASLAVPNMDGARTGSCIITWTGNGTDLQGRVHTIKSNEQQSQYGPMIGVD